MPTLRIKLGNRLVGAITNVVTDKNIFVFDSEYGPRVFIPGS